MANFTGRLALPCPESRCGMGYKFGHSSTSLTDLRTASLLLGSTLTDDFESPVCGWRISGNALHEIHTVVEEP